MMIVSYLPVYRSCRIRKVGVTSTTALHNREIREGRKQKLQEIGFTWDAPGKAAREAATIWNKKYEELEAYVNANGDCLVPYRSAEHLKLGRWVSRQRQLYNT